MALPRGAGHAGAQSRQGSAEPTPAMLPMGQGGAEEWRSPQALLSPAGRDGGVWRRTAGEEGRGGPRLTPDPHRKRRIRSWSVPRSRSALRLMSRRRTC